MRFFNQKSPSKFIRVSDLKPGQVVPAPLGDPGMVTVKSVKLMDGKTAPLNVIKGSNGIMALQIEFDNYITVMSNPFSKIPCT